MNTFDKEQPFYENPIFINFLILGITIFFFIIKLTLALLTNSLALQADAIDNFKDIVMFIAALIGTLYVKKKPNKKFPYGYYKIENIISLVISILIFLTAVNIIFQSFSEISLYFEGNSKIVKTTPYIFIFLVISLVITFGLGIYLKIIGKKTKSPILESEAKEKFYDLLISFSVLAGFIASYFNIYVLDSIIGLIIAFFIIKGGYEIFIASIKVLLDAVIDFENRTELLKLIENFPKIQKVENLQIRAYGKYIFLEIEVILNKDLPLSLLNTFKSNLANKIKQKFVQIFKIIIIAQTQEKKTMKVAVPLLDNYGVDSTLSDHFGDAPYFAFLEFFGMQLLSFEILTNKFIQEEKRKGILVSDWLCSNKIDKIYLKKELKRGPLLVFENSFIEIHIIQFDKLEEVIISEIEALKITN